MSDLAPMNRAPWIPLHQWMQTAKIDDLPPGSTLTLRHGDTVQRYVVGQPEPVYEPYTRITGTHDRTERP